VQIVTAESGDVTLAWDEAAAGRRRVVVSHLSQSREGFATFSRDVLGHATANEYPALATASDAVVAAWVERDAATAGIRIARVVR